MKFDEVLNTFVAESRELLQEMEDALLKIEQAPDDADTLNAIFRAAHTIKGSAGLFGLDELVAFTHGAESVLDQVRSGAVAIDAALAALLLGVCDHIGILVQHVAQGCAPDQAVRAAGVALSARLHACLGQTAAAPGGGHWHLSLGFGADVFRNGMDPLSFIRYLGTLGTIEGIAIECRDLPPLAEMDPETCYLGFEIGLRSDAGQAALEAVFDFVREDSRIRILGPGSKPSDYLALIGAAARQEARPGAFLVECGTLSEAELAQALRSQAGPAVPDRPPRAKEGKAGETSLIRVDADKLDQLINLVGELLIAGAGVQLIARQNKDAGLLEASSTMSRLVEQVRDSALTLRMVEIGSTFNRFQRVVHDVSREMGKEIALHISGAETELDKTVVEKIGDPLLHLVRNAIDHGIEPASARLACGKPACGALRLNAFHDSGSVVIEVADDGGGLCRDKILRKALQRGLVAEGQVLSDQEVWHLVFEPGFSTSEQVSELSGRGVGMDVVRRNIGAMRGSVELASIEGQGTTVRIRLPLTLAIIDGFLVSAGNAAFVIPLDLVVECIELAPEDRCAAQRNYISLRGQVLPYLKLRDMFELEGEPARRENLVVVQYGGVRIGLVVDVLLGEIQTVIKPLGRMFSQINGIGGSTILGSGAVALILDVPALARQVSALEQSTLARARQERNRAQAN